MTYQIREIILFNSDGETRRVQFELNRTNIIVGSSASGKTALIKIIDYCLGSSEFTVPGKIRRVVSWYSLLLQLPNNQVFIARKAPAIGKATSSEYYYATAEIVAIPNLVSLAPNANTDTAVARLSRDCGILENRQERPSGLGTPVTIEHATWFSLQNQSELAQDEALFHRQTEEWRPQTIRDALPFLLGAVDEDSLAKRDELKDLRRRLKEKESEYTNEQSTVNSTLSQANLLWQELSNSGIISPEKLRPTSSDAILSEIKAVIEAHSEIPELPQIPAALTNLLQLDSEIREEYERVRQSLQEALQIRREDSAYANELNEQVSRLKSVKVFKQSDGHALCPLCEQTVEQLPKIAEMQAALQRGSDQLASIKRTLPNRDSLIERLEKESKVLQERWKHIRTQIKVLQDQDAEMRRTKELEAYQAFVRGRASAFIQGYKSPFDLQKLALELDKLKEQIEQLEELIQNLPAENLDTRLAMFSFHIGRFAKAWKLEESENSISLDLRRLTLKFATASGTTYLKTIGSAQNHVGYHVAAHLALHQIFIELNRPTPRFLFLDQPSTPFFPEDKVPQAELAETSKLRDEDRDFLTMLFQDLIRYVQEKQRFQLIITEHANFLEPWFQDCVIERWRHGQKLIPSQWLENLDEGVQD